MRYNVIEICIFLRKAMPVAAALLMSAAIASRPAVAEEPLLRFVQWNDMHIQATMPFPFRLTNLQYLVNAMNEETYFPKPDFVIGVGDMIHGGDGVDNFPADYALLKTTLAPLECTYYPVVGNHENLGNEGSSVYEAAYVDAFGADRLNYSFRAGGIEFIMLNDSGSPASNPTAVGTARRQWLQGLLEASPGVPKIISTHIPMVPLREEDVLAASFGFVSYITHDDAMLALIDAHADDVLAVLSGHLHLSGMVLRNGVSHIVTSGTAGYPYDFASYEVYSDHISVNMHTLPEEMHVPSPITHGIPRHEIDYTDATHPTHDLYLRGNPTERSFEIPIPQLPPPQVFINGDFEAGPFDTGWSNGAGALQHSGLDESASAAYFDNENRTGTFNQMYATRPQWVFEMSFAAADHLTGRSLNLGLTHPGSLGINLRTVHGNLEVYDQTLGWQTLLEDVISFSVDADGDNDFTSEGDTLAVHHLRIEGHYGAQQPYYDIFLSNADSNDVNDNVALNVKFWQNSPPSNWQGLSSVAFYATGAPGGDYVVDNIRLNPTAPIPGDANNDGKVDGMDASILADNWQTQTGAAWADGDFNSDGKVDETDATMLAANWHSGAGADSVPEPSLLTLLGGALAVWGLKRL